VRVGSGALTYEVAEPWLLPIEGPNHEVAGVAVNSRDEVHVFTRSPHPMLVFDRKGRLLRSWGEGIFNTPHGIHIGPDDMVYAIDAGDSTVRKFSPAGELLLTLGEKDRHSDTGIAEDGDHRTIARGAPPFHWPTNAAVGPNDELFVSDGYGNARVHRFAEDGTLLASWGTPGTGPGEFVIPHGVCVDRHGTVHVADRENDRIQRFTVDGTYLGEADNARRPADVFVTDDDLVVACEMGHAAALVVGMPAPTPTTPSSRVTLRAIDGTLLDAFGADDTPDRDPCAPGFFFAAHGIWVDRHGTVYVGEVSYSTNGAVNPGPGNPRVALDCHALQVFHRV
jgi:DNA-binding beta-propeller fold protein YncE